MLSAKIASKKVLMALAAIRCQLIISILIFIASVFFCPITAAGLPFAAGEKLKFEVKWEFVPAGTAEMQVRRGQFKGGEAFHFLLKARTNSFVDIFYELRQRIDSYTDPSVERSYLYKELNKGSNEKNITVSFDLDQMQVTYSNFGKQKEPVSIRQGTLDPLASFYAFRKLDLRQGAEFELPVTDGKKHFLAKAAIVDREMIEANGKRFDAYVIKPDLTFFGGVFAESEDPALTIWLTADQCRIPVKIEVKVAVGSVIAELVSAEGLINQHSGR